MKQQPAMTNNQSHPQHHLSVAAGVQLSQQQQHLQHQRHLSQQQQQPQSQQIQIQQQQQQLTQQQIHQHHLNQSQHQQQHSLPQQQFQHHQNQNQNQNQNQQQELQHQRAQHLQEPHQHVQSPAASACHQQQMPAGNMQQRQTQATSTATTSNSQMLKKELPANGKKTKGRVRIKMEFIHNKLRRYTTFSKRKTGIMKKAFELATLTGTQVMLLVASETGHVYTFATKKLQPMIISEAGKALIQTCLNSPDSDNLLMSAGPSGPASAVSQASPSASSSASSGPSTPGSSGSPQHQLQLHHHQQQQHQLPPVPVTVPVQQQQQQSQQVMARPSTHLSSSSGGPMQYTQNSARSQCPAGPGQVQSRHNMMLATNTDQIQQQQMMQHHVRTPSSCAQQQQQVPPTSSSSSTPSNHPSTDQRMSATGFEETDLSYSINDDLNDRSTFDTYSSALAGLISADQEPQTATASNQLVASETIGKQADEHSANRYRKMIEPNQAGVTRGHQFSNNPLYVAGQTLADQQPAQFQPNLSSSSSSTLGPQTGDESVISGHMSTSYQYTSSSGSVQLASGESGSQKAAAKQTTACASCVHHQQDNHHHQQQQHLYTPSNRSLGRQQAASAGFKCASVDTSITRNFNATTLAEECNGALFMEYQTSRSQVAGGAGGCLEELQSLHVNACDADTLEEHMNLLSSDDCFSNQYELQDFGGDNFLNMLCLNNNNNNNSSITTTTVGGPQQSQLTNCAGSATSAGNQPTSELVYLSSTPSLVNECSESAIGEPSPQLLIRCSHLLNNGSGSSGIASSFATSSSNSSSSSSSSSSTNSNSSTGSAPGNTKRTTGRKSKSKGSKQATSLEQSKQQNKIATTNTNRSLLPKRASAASASTGVCNPRSTTVLRLTSDSQHHDKSCLGGNSRGGNNAHRLAASSQVLVGPQPATVQLQTGASSVVVCGASSHQSNGHGGAEWADTGYRQQLEKLRKKLKMDVVDSMAAPTGGAAAQLLDSTGRPLKECTTNSQEAPVVSLATCHQPAQTTTSGAGCKQPGSGGLGPTAYLIARPLVEGLESSGGTIYLRTANGLVPISSGAGHSRSCDGTG